MRQYSAEGVNVILHSEHKTLLYRNNSGIWRFPGGTFIKDTDTDLIDCCERECREETGLRISREALKPLLSFPIIETPKKPSHDPMFVDHYFLMAGNVDTEPEMHPDAEVLWAHPRTAFTLLSYVIDKYALQEALRTNHDGTENTDDGTCAHE